MSRLPQMILFVLVGAHLSAGAASACSIYGEAPAFSRVPVRGENCAVYYPEEDEEGVSLERAADMGKGFVFQPVSTGHPCTPYEMSAVHDCNTGQVVLVGGVWGGMVYIREQDRHTIRRPLKRLNELVHNRAKRGRHMPLLKISRWAERAHLPVNSMKKLADTISIDDRRVDLQCACKLFYPELMEKSE